MDKLPFASNKTKGDPITTEVKNSFLNFIKGKVKTRRKIYAPSYDQKSGSVY